MRSSDWSSYVCSSDLSLTRRSIRLWILGVSASEVRFMKIGFASIGPEDVHALAVLVGKDRALTPPAEAADQATGGQLRRALADSRFDGDAAQLEEVLAPYGMNAYRLLAVGTGAPGKAIGRAPV